VNKRSRRPGPPGDDPGMPAQQPATPPASAASSPGGGSRSTRTTPTTRAARRRTRPVTRHDERSVFDRYRGLLLGGFALLGLGIIAFLFLRGTGASAYTCAEQLQPGPTEPVPTPVRSVTAAPTAAVTAGPSPSAPESPPADETASPPPDASPSVEGSPSPDGSPAATDAASPTATEAPTATESPAVTESPAPSPSPGATETAAPSPGATAEASPSPSPSPTAAPSPTRRVGFTTQDLGNTHVRTGTSIRYHFCPPTSGDHYSEVGLGPIPRDFYTAERELRPGGWVHNLEHGWVVAVYSCRDGCPSSDEMAEMRRVFDSVPTPPGGEACGDNKIIVVRFDQMSSRFAMLAWDRAMLMDTFDFDQAVAFAEQFMDPPQAPEAGRC
jgi:hypothetical protein